MPAVSPIQEEERDVRGFERSIHKGVGRVVQ